MNLQHPGSSPESDIPTLVLIFKRPKPGQGKQRLAVDIGLWSACQLAECFLNCALEDLQSWSGPVVLSPAMAEDKAWAEQLLPEADVVVQSEGNLGHRILALDESLREQGHRSLIYIGSDAPMLKAIHFQTVAQTLTGQSVVVCPASDGGVTIMANAQPWPQALETLPWSTEQLGPCLIDCCQQAELDVASVLSSYDIDQKPDLVRLRDDLIDDPRPQRQRLLALIEQLDSVETSDAPNDDDKKQPALA